MNFWLFHSALQTCQQRFKRWWILFCDWRPYIHWQICLICTVPWGFRHDDDNDDDVLFQSSSRLNVFYCMFEVNLRRTMRGFKHETPHLARRTHCVSAPLVVKIAIIDWPYPLTGLRCIRIRFEGIVVASISGWPIVWCILDNCRIPNFINWPIVWDFIPTRKALCPILLP